jgi:alkylation response protein AidB-like acyl-CoA dehydrogenase
VLAEDMRTLPPATVATLSSLGLFWLKTPAEFGGTPLTPLEFCDVIEELAYIDASTAWATMIGNGCGGMAGGGCRTRARGGCSAPVRPKPVLAPCR